jgi:hypothetical protein
MEEESKDPETALADIAASRRSHETSSDWKFADITKNMLIKIDALK